MIIRREKNFEKMNKSFKYFSPSYCDSLKQKQSNNYKYFSYKFTSLRFLSGVNAGITFCNRSRGKINILKWRFGQYALQPWKSTFLLRELNNFIYNYGSMDPAFTGVPLPAVYYIELTHISDQVLQSLRLTGWTLIASFKRSVVRILV